MAVAAHNTINAPKLMATIIVAVIAINMVFSPVRLTPLN
jgi:hypothetical protein